jgi:hypothetical protein
MLMQFYIEIQTLNFGHKNSNKAHLSDRVSVRFVPCISVILLIQHLCQALTEFRW